MSHKNIWIICGKCGRNDSWELDIDDEYGKFPTLNSEHIEISMHCQNCGELGVLNEFVKVKQPKTKS